MLINSVFVFGQNLVPNYDFEDYSSLPTDGGQWSYCNNWTNAGGSPVDGYYGNPDYFHVSGTSPVQLPSTALAYVEPYSGNAVMGFLGYHDPYMTSENIREYIMVQLSTPLVIGEVYDVSFQITNGFSGIGHYLSVDKIGAAFSAGPLSQVGSSYINQETQWELDSNLFVTEWTTMSFGFVADQAYEYLTLGNFRPDSLLNIEVALSGPLPFAGAYYFVDSVVVELSDEVAETVDLNENSISIFPNPAANQIMVSSAYKGITFFEIHQINGQLVRSGQFQSTAHLDISELKGGLYIIKFTTPSGSNIQRFVKSF